MKKELISASQLDSFTCLHGPRIYADPAHYILSPGAKDELTRRHIEIVYGPCPDYPSCGHTMGGQPSGGVDDFTISVAAVLKKDYGISDPDKLREMTLQVVKTLKDSI